MDVPIFNLTFMQFNQENQKENKQKRLNIKTEEKKQRQQIRQNEIKDKTKVAQDQIGYVYIYIYIYIRKESKYNYFMNVFQFYVNARHFLKGIQSMLSTLSSAVLKSAQSYERSIDIYEGYQQQPLHTVSWV